MKVAAGRDYALDASALLAVMLLERGQDQVRSVMDRAFMHAVNVAEVVGKLIREGVPADEASASIEELQLEIARDFGVAEAVACGRLLAETRALGQSLGDCLCLTVAARAGATAVTAERLWK